MIYCQMDAQNKVLRKVFSFPTGVKNQTNNNLARTLYTKYTKNVKTGMILIYCTLH